MTTSHARFLAGLALSAAVIFGAPSASRAQPLGSVPSEIAPNGFPVAGCSRSADQEALRIKQLIAFVEKYRRMAVRNPVLRADVGYYEAELAASRRCLQAIATG